MTIVRFLPRGVLAVSLLLLFAGAYLWHQSLGTVEAPSQKEVEGAATPKIAAELFLYPQAAILSRSQSTATWQLTLETSDSLSRVYGFYENLLLTAGWTKEKEQKTDDGVQLHLSREGQTLEVNLTANLKDKKTVILLYLET